MGREVLLSLTCYMAQQQVIECDNTINKLVEAHKWKDGIENEAWFTNIRVYKIIKLCIT
jgi:hypothetical protein